MHARWALKDSQGFKGGLTLVVVLGENDFLLALKLFPHPGKGLWRDALEQQHS